MSWEPPEISTRDAEWAAGLLGLPTNAFLGNSGNDPRWDVLKAVKSLDVAACPGSGKTTLLVAKLAIVAKYWTDRTRGICVLSHTNAARSEIESRLGTTGEGQALLSYPHFVGTIDGFVNRFLALPALRRRGYPVEIIDSDYSQERRWRSLPQACQTALASKYVNATIMAVSDSDLNWNGSIPGNFTTQKKAEYRGYVEAACRKSIERGHHCHDEMHIWAADQLACAPEVVYRIRDRFPLLFIDESQDTSEERSALLDQVFDARGGGVVRQRFGDPNQAIFHSVGAKHEVKTDPFPLSDASRVAELPDSRRFGSEIANAAQHLELHPYSSALVGAGPIVERKTRDCIVPAHTIFLLTAATIGKVLPAYGQLILDTFEDDVLDHGHFAAVGAVHSEDKVEAPPPHVVQHYWAPYKRSHVNRGTLPRTMIETVRVARSRISTNQLAADGMEIIADGVLRLVGMQTDTGFVRRRQRKFLYSKQLFEAVGVGREYSEWAHALLSVPHESEGSWKQRARGISALACRVAGREQPSGDATVFLKWQEPASEMDEESESRETVFRWPVHEPRVAVHLSSIHAVKGQTHTGTLVLETKWHGKNLESLLSPLSGARISDPKVRQRTRMKWHYVAMTRPSHLLCLAMSRDSVQNAAGDLDQEKIDGLKGNGWRVFDLTTMSSI